MMLMMMMVMQERLLHIPSWSWHGGASSDEIICISELKMGIMAQNSLAPGIVTLLANLTKPHRFKVRIHNCLDRHQNYVNDFVKNITSDSLDRLFMFYSLYVGVRI